jgi:hypothetical protein
MADVFGRSIRAIFGDGSPAERLSDYADLDEYALLHQAALWVRGERIAARPVPGDGTVTEDVADGWRAVLLRRPRWRSETELRFEYEPGGRPDAAIAALGPEEPGRVAIDLAEVDARPARSDDADALLAVEGRDGRVVSLARSLARLPAFALIARRYRRRD